MSQGPKVTVYIASFNCEDYLVDAIESVLTQSFEDWELIIIDDNSKDDSWEIVQRYKADPRIRVTKTEGLGLPGVCNLALNMAKGEYIVRLDGDDVLDENMLLVLSNYLDRNQDVALVFPDYFLMTADGNIFSHERLEKVYSKNHMHDIPPNGACTMFRTAQMKEAGGYREDLGSQDGFDIWTKLLDKYSYGNVNLPLFYYRRHNHNLTNNQQRILYSRLQIKKDFVAERLEDTKPIIAVVPCRSMYDFEPNLWKQEINGKSLLEHQLDVLIPSEVFDHIVICSDTEETQSVLKKYDDKRIQQIHRPTNYTYQSVPFSRSLKLVIEKLDPDHKGLTTISYLETPFKTKSMIEESIYTLLMTNSDSAIAAEKIQYPIYQRKDHGLDLLNQKSTVSADLGMLYREIGTIFTLKNENMKHGSLTGSRIANFTISHDEGFYVNSKQSLKVANFLASRNE
jgi:glycosyltransferase involved in cell wall biosynthesis